jgi:glycosyltransferase involved in cell wall biosynthesis
MGLKNVIFLGDRQDLPFILKDVDAFMLTSRREAFGMVLLEAMAAGCPVIASRIPGPASIIQNEINGLLVDTGDVQGFATCLGKLISDPVFSARMVGNARKMIQKYDINIIGRRLSEIYTEVFQEQGIELP